MQPISAEPHLHPKERPLHDMNDEKLLARGGQEHATRRRRAPLEARYAAFHASVVALCLLASGSSCFEEASGDASTTASSTGGSVPSQSTSSSGLGTSSTEGTSTGSASEVTTDATTDATSGGTGGECVDEPRPDEVCSVYSQDCPRGQKCNAWASEGAAWDSVGCFPVAPDPDPIGEPCTTDDRGSGLDSCEVGAMCMAGLCVEICSCSETTPVCNTPNTECSSFNGGSLVLCEQTCDPLADECEDSHICVPNPSSEGFICIPKGADRGALENCVFVNDCAQGLHCSKSDTLPKWCTFGCCMPYCDVKGPPCPEDLSCVPWYEGEAPEGLEDVGICL